MSTTDSHSNGLFDRSLKESCPVPRYLFSFLRAIDPYLQYLLISEGFGVQLLSQLGLSSGSAGPKGQVLVAMAAGCALKQIINMIYIIEVKMTPGPIVGICLYNTISNSVSSLSALMYGPSLELGPMQYAGISLFTVGVFAELVSEIQRKQFKDNPDNKGKLYTGGLFSLARHINYGGYTLWRTGIALTSGNYWWAAFQFFGHMAYFTKSAVPELSSYCSKRYGDEWKKFERDVPNTLIPYVW